MEALERAKQHSWYHSLELAPGHVTDGMFDLRPYVHLYGLPDRLDGVRTLDVGTFDGFWAFELERRGAEGIALDVDDVRDLDFPPRRRPTEAPDVPRGETFRIAREALGSNVERVSCNLYDASPERLGTFDLVFCGSVLMHVRDQLLALERLASVCRSEGRLLLTEEYDRRAQLAPFLGSRYLADRDSAVVFWLPSARTWKQMVWTAGFENVEEKRKFKLKSPRGFSVPHVSIHASGPKA